MNTNAYTLIGRATCQLLDKNTPICNETIAEVVFSIFHAEYSGAYDEQCEAFNDAMKLLVNNPIK
ncbi:hypothetical protein [Xenorhabdus hominickii]|uniref:Uncharacterized protein n=1 Tax=Xenorhabdus hominickii TaxID=351679 RepID=A0A2G0Q2L1_XENHO|nr:hypothetical protein [Xenorhabdus hominickii]AOM39695.1 hypothetical protein A9255_03280 [Xenorhabdus hominickii]PHM53456.1 hypothetical protein Xhom_03454 [Xenorhabdus hominickii]